MKKINKKIVSVILSVLLMLSVMPVGALSVQADALSDAKAAYVAKINDMKNNGTIYTNTIYAYLKYIAACADNAGATEAADLQNAVNAMTVFSPKKGNASVSINGTAATGCYSNVLWAENPTALKYEDMSHGYIYWDNGILIYHGDYFIYQPSAVVLYDGTTDAKIPVLFAEQENQGNYRFRYGYITETDGRLGGDWAGYSTAPRDGTSAAVNAAWPSDTGYSICGSAVGYENTYFDANTEHGSKCDFYNFKNSLVFNPGDSLYKKYTSFEWDVHAYWWNTVTQREHVSEGDNSVRTEREVFVLNYKKLLDAIDEMLARFSGAESLLDTTTAQFANGNSANLFGALDKATSLDLSDPTKYDYETDLVGAVTNAYTDLNSAIKDLNSANSSEGTVSTLASYIVKYEQNMKENPFRSDLEDTYKLYLKAKECFDAYMFGQNKTQAFLDRVSEVASAFQTAVDNQKEFATKNNDGTYTAKVYTGEYTPASGVKFFEEDDVSGGNAYTYYNDTVEAANNILYYPTVMVDNPIIRCDTTGKICVNQTGENIPIKFRLYYPDNVVLLYNGANNAKFPVMAMSGSTEGGSGCDSWLRWIYPTTHEQQGVYKTGTNYNSLLNYLYADRTDFGIRQYTVYGYNDYSVPYGWQGGARNDKMRAPLNWNITWNQNTTTYNNNVSNVSGKSDANNNGADYGRVRINKSQEGVYTVGVASAVEYKDTYFASNPAVALKNYPSMNWNIIWSEEPWLQYYGRDRVETANSDINVINTIPVTNAIQSLVGNSDVKDILNYVYLYDGDAADYIELLKKIDAIGDFDPNFYDADEHPNGYDFNNTTGGSGTYSANKGVDDCVADIYNIVEEVADVENVIGDEEGEGVVVPPSAEDKQKESSSTETDNPDEENWYGDLRNALMSPEEYDDCSDDEKWSDYETALTNARNAITAAAMSDSIFYPATYNGKTISEYAEELNEAKAAYLAAPGKHIYEYETENANQISEWDCASNEIHTHATADMSAYNELEIAYETIDPEAYDNFESLVAAKYDGNAYDDSSEEAKDYSDLSFKEVKTKKTKKGENPQDFVDQGVMNLLEAINTAATENAGEHLNSYKVNFDVKVAGEDVSHVLINQTYKYGARPTLNAADSPVFNLYGGQCYKWSVKIGDGEERFIDSKSSAFTCTVQRDCTITAYANKALASDQAKITVIGPTGSTLDVVHAAKTASVAFSFDSTNKKASVSIGGVNYDIASTPSYTVTGVTLNGANDEDYAGRSGLTVQGLLESLNVKELRIRPIKTGAYKESTYTVNAYGTGGTVNNNNETGTESTLSGIAYDTKIRVNYTPDTSKGTYYGMVINESEMAGGSVARYIPITYGDEYYFRAISDMNFYPLYQRTLDGGAKAYYVDDGSADGVRITNSDTVYRLQHKLPFILSFMDGQRLVDGNVVPGNVPGKFFFRCVYTQGLPDNVKVTEAGWVYFYCHDDNISNAVSALSPDEANLTVNNVKEVTEGGFTGSINRYASTKLDTAEVRETHQYSFSSKDAENTYILGRGYIKYEYTFSESVANGETTTTVEAPIEAVSYGRADFYMNPLTNS